MRWDIFCHIIDNYGDLGVCWRLARDLATRDQSVTLWLDDARSAQAILHWLAPEAMRTNAERAIRIRYWHEAAHYRAGAVLIEAFGCQLPHAVLQHLDAAAQAPVWLNLEYLSAEDYVARMHLLPSPQSLPSGRSLNKTFFYPGFTWATGGLLREQDLPSRQARFAPQQWLRQQGVQTAPTETLISLFCYEPASLVAWLQMLSLQAQPSQILVCAGRSYSAFTAALHALGVRAGEDKLGQLRWHALPHLTQQDYDHLLWSCDVNMVRGEDSLVRALWAGKAFVWQLYPQEDGAHHGKLAAFLNQVKAPEAVCTAHRAWNADQHSNITAIAGVDWQNVLQSSAFYQHLCAQLSEQADLSSQLLAWVLAQHNSAS